ncbi:hypothetical protein [Yoonia sp. SDW83-1]|uniref:hypothetical protein n=1 Tax=Yoonia sp. SDW83-1 TaxID=3366945 RepID=UPI00398C3586
MSKRPNISARRAAQVFKEAVACRRLFRGDGKFFKMSEFWEYLCAENDCWKIKQTKSGPLSDYQRRAGVVAFGDLMTLVVDSELMRLARLGRGFANFILAHEMCHLMLDHHANAKVIKNFKVVDSETGKSVLPPTDEELETNYAAIFLQCGMALFDERLSAVELARRAYTDVALVKKAKSLVRIPEFKSELERISKQRPRVVF